MKTALDTWSEFLVHTLPGVAPDREVLWRATLDAAQMLPSEYLGLSQRRRQRVAPLPDVALTALERRLPDWQRLQAPAGAGEDLWLLHAGAEYWPAKALDCLGGRAPDYLVGWGNPSLLTSSLVAVVGSRDAPPGAVQQAEIIARSLVELGFGVISGGARGIDESAHRGALGGGGATVFMLAEGLAIAPEFQTRADLDPDRVCLLSCVWPFQRWTTTEALARNRVIVALAQGVVVVAAKMSGGSLMTGETALDLERPTLALDHGEVTVHTAGNRRLMQRGATPLRADAFTEGHAPDELRTALGLAAAPKPRTGDLFEGLKS
jgi:predicted Rossmann fold nucleotide-binding protein DprA/Smf involved in DNA uptake